MASLLIKGGRVLSPEDGLDGVLDVLVQDGVIREIAPSLNARADRTIDARGQIVSPGFVDLHAHLREPGGEISETLETGLAAAVAGGFTSVCAMPNTRPVNDRAESTHALIERAKKIGQARVFPIAAVSLGSEGEELTDFAGLIAAGAVAFSDDGRPVKTPELMQRAMEMARPLGVPIIDHCEDPALSAGGSINEGLVSERMSMKGIPNASEDGCVARDLGVAELTGAHLHVAHLSTARACEMVREAKRRGIRVTCEVTPHHFTLSDVAVEKYGTHAKMNPPLRSAQDLEGILAGIAGGTVDVLATDHAPHAPELKSKPIADAPFGIIGFETALALALTQLVHPGKISMAHLIVLMSSNPAHIIRQEVNPALGRLKAGGAADITVFDPQREWTYRAAEGRSKSRNSPFDGWKLKGLITTTIVLGKIVYDRK
ncbi:MAG: dihydroorotase [Terriglobia bacterium]